MALAGMPAATTLCCCLPGSSFDNRDSMTRGRTRSSPGGANASTNTNDDHADGVHGRGVDGTRWSGRGTAGADRTPYPAGTADRAEGNPRTNLDPGSAGSAG